MSKYLRGSICLSDIPKELIRKVQCKDGQTRAYIDVMILTKRSPQTFQRSWGNQTFTHSMAVAVRPSERKEGVNYFIADLETRISQPQQQTQPQQAVQPTQASSPFAAADNNEEYPF